MIFEYSVQKTFTESIDIVDFGNTAIRCTENNIVDYYILVKTVLGKTHIIEFGPVAPDIPSLCDGFNISYKKIDYKEAAIFKEISKYINYFKNGMYLHFTTTHNIISTATLNSIEKSFFVGLHNNFYINKTHPS